MKQLKICSSFTLKCIAMVTMLIDHLGSVLFPAQLWLRAIGRISFPLYCFLLVQGFTHTRDRRKYALRLTAFAVISEIPYDLAFSGTVWYTGRQNVFFTLLAGLLVLLLLEYECSQWLKYLGAAAAFAAVYYLKTDYNVHGLLLIICFYFFRFHWGMQTLSLGVVNMNMILMGSRPLQMYGLAAMVPIGLYNGERGRSMKFLAYAFYPIHLLVLFLIKRYWI